MLSRSLFVLVWLGVAVTPAIAQQPEPPPLEEPTIARWMIIVLAILLAAAVVLPSFKDAKRGGQG